MTARRLLIVDDSSADRTALRIAFERCGLPITLSFAESAAAALARLGGAEPAPHMMLVDVHMPGGSGLELLAALKRDERWRLIPVFMLSGSKDPRDVTAAYRGAASGFLPKPANFEGLRRLAELMARLCVEALAFC